MGKVKIKKQKLYKIKLTKFELIHLRDLFNLTLPHATSTISQVLAQNENRYRTEAKFWHKIVELCLDANVPLGDEAPAYAIKQFATPDFRLVQVQHNESQHQNCFIDCELSCKDKKVNKNSGGLT